MLSLGMDNRSNSADNLRKVSSIHSDGMIDYRNDEERVARSARLTKKQVKKGNKLLREQLKEMKRD